MHQWTLPDLNIVFTWSLQVVFVFRSSKTVSNNHIFVFRTTKNASSTCKLRSFTLRSEHSISSSARLAILTASGQTLIFTVMRTPLEVPELLSSPVHVWDYIYMTKLLPQFNCDWRTHQHINALVRPPSMFWNWLELETTDWATWIKWFFFSANISAMWTPNSD